MHGHETVFHIKCKENCLVVCRNTNRRMSIAVEFRDVVKRFPNAAENAVDHVSFQIQEKEMITILGTSGCGKTTLMKMVNRLYDPTSGEIHVFGENIQKTDPVQLRRKIGYVC